jgi:hypothetical protein
MDIHDGYWSEPSDELDSDGKPIKRQRWIFTNPAHPSNQTGQGSPSLPREISHNSSEVEYGEPESTDNGTRLSFNGNPPTYANPDSERTAESDRVVRTGGTDNNNLPDSSEVINETGQKDQTTGVDDTQQHDNSDSDPVGLTRPDDDSRVGDGVVEPEVKPVPQPRLRLVNPVPQTNKKRKRASGSTGKKAVNVHPVPHPVSSNNPNRIHPPTMSGYKWKPSGLTGWELYSRKPSISESGKRSSKSKYIAYYSQKAVERMIHEREKAANARTA